MRVFEDITLQLSGGDFIRGPTMLSPF